MDHEEFRKWGKEMVDYVADYWKNMRDRKPVPSVEPGYLRALMPTAAPQNAEPWQNIFGDLEQVVMKGTTHWHHPHFFAYYPTANSYPAVIGDILSSGLGTIGFSWASSPAMTELELIMLDWLAKMLKLPNRFFNSDPGPGVGMIQATASDCTFLAILVARNKMLKTVVQNKWDVFLQNKLVVYASEYAHSAAERAGLLMNVLVRKVPTDEHFAMCPTDLEKIIKEDVTNGFLPLFVCATLGGTASCAFDDLTQIGPICKEHNLYLHVDAAYAGTAFICEEYRHWLNGVEFANSFNFNPHKMMLVNFDCSAMWFEDAHDIEQAFLVDPEFLKHQHQGTVTDFRNLQIPLGRRFRAIKLWFVLRAFGVCGIQEHVRRQCRLAKQFEQLVKSDPQFEIVADVVLGLVCFRLKISNEANEALFKLINEDKRIHLVVAQLKGKFTLRFVVCSTMTNENDIVFAWSVIRELSKSLSLVSS